MLDNNSYQVGQPYLGKPLTMQELYQANRLYTAAVTVQKYIRGQLARKNMSYEMKAYFFFKKV